MLYGLGINHNTAPIDIREQVTFPREHLGKYLRMLRSHVDEAAILSTCNRTEIYCSLPATETDGIKGWLHRCFDLVENYLNPHIYQLRDGDLVYHMMRVAAGMDSMIVGEPQIMGQMKQAHRAARSAGSINYQLERLFQDTFQAAKYVRSNTAISQKSTSIPRAATEFVRHIFDAVHKRTALLIGAGEVIENVAFHLQEQGIGNLVFANRQHHRSQLLAERFSGYTIGLERIHQYLARADIVVSATAAPVAIIGKGMVESALKSRAKKPLLLIDLAVPRDIEPQIEQLANAYLYCIDDIQNLALGNEANRKKAIADGEAIVRRHGEEFMRWLKLRELTPVLRQLRGVAEEMQHKSLNQARRSLASGKDPEIVVGQLAEQLTNRLIHAPTAALKRAAEEGNTAVIRLLEEIYAQK